jgi:hypothetical protein
MRMQHRHNFTEASGRLQASIYFRHLWGGEISPKVPTSLPPKFFELDLNFCLFQCDSPPRTLNSPPPPSAEGSRINTVFRQLNRPKKLNDSSLSLLRTSIVEMGLVRLYRMKSICLRSTARIQKNFPRKIAA